MAKVTGSTTKITFGKRKTGKSKKRKGPKDKPVSKYIGQGN